MTGYGTGRARCRGGQITVEIRCLNHRFLDLRVKVPREYAALESAVRERIRGSVARGRVEVSVERVAAPRAPVQVEVDRALARSYVTAWRRLKAETGLAGDVDLSVLQGRPEIFHLGQGPPPVPEPEALWRALGAGLRALDRERRREGRHLQNDMRRHLRYLGRIENGLRRRAVAAGRLLRARLHRRVAAVLGGTPVDPGRLAQELALVAERSDVTEEVVRLQSHLTALWRLLDRAGPVGKPMDFLLQEIQRELNTIGSKISDLPGIRLVLEGKNQVEKLREQVQNVE